MVSIDVIRQFHYKEMQSMIHNDEYLDAILKTENLEDLCDVVIQWRIVSPQDKNVAAFYILETLEY
tara:strand:+ start:315 stop:512 length:198 start_codon:yes stop_codon:yes gene_type:complete